MFDSRHLKLLTAVLVATWSPGSWFCCCSTADAASQPAQEIQECRTLSCCAIGQETRNPAPPPVDQDCGGCPFGLPGDEHDCGCLHAPSDATLNKSFVVPAGKHVLGDVDLLVELPPGLGTPAVLRVSTCRGSPRAALKQTLITLHCQLTT